MDEDPTQPSTQIQVHRDHSDLSNADVADVMCILHPCTPASFKVVAHTAVNNPQLVLRKDKYRDMDDGLTQSKLEEQETFILNSGGPGHILDLVLRFSAKAMNPSLGFMFGRSPRHCDVVLSTDSNKRVSNLHFAIYSNDAGVLLLQDHSTNGTMVDDVLLKGKFKTAVGPQTRMLNTGSIIQILSPQADEILKFVVRIPSREGHLAEYTKRIQEYLKQREIAMEGPDGQNSDLTRLIAARPRAGPCKAPYARQRQGMSWSGGDKYNVLGHIGSGAFANVWQLATKSEGKLFAAKELEKRRFMKNGVLDRKLSNEMKIMQSISHPHIVQFIDYVDHIDHMYIIMEFVPGGDLQKYLQVFGMLAENVGKTMAAQVLDALGYLHSKKVTHRDIKPDNILIFNLDAENFNVKLSDFGLSKVVRDEDATFLKTFCGTLLYCAPEVFPQYDAHANVRGQKRQRKSSLQTTKFHSYSQSVDIWSFGAVLWYSLCLEPPFEGIADPHGNRMFARIMNTPLDTTQLTKKGISDDGIALLTSMLNTDPASRPLPHDCLQHSWFGNQQAKAGALPLLPGLRAIVEEEEENAAPEAQGLAGLSLYDYQGERSQEDSFDEVSIHAGSLRFFDPRQSKRFKSEAFAYREQPDRSSAEWLPAISENGLREESPLLPDLPGKDFNPTASTGKDTKTRPPSTPKDGPSSSPKGPNLSTTSQPNLIHSPSLEGAASLMREIHMKSRTTSPAVELHTPPNNESLTSSQTTPKPAPFNRRIALPPPTTPSVPQPPRVLGTLTSTPDSFTPLTLALTTRTTTWGRAPNNTHVYPDRLDTRIPKRGIMIWFHAVGIEDVPESSPWTEMPDLHCVVSTESHRGIWINGVHLVNDEPGKWKFGRVFSGDEITVYRAVQGERGLRFRCEFKFGEGRDRRDPRGGRFEVLRGYADRQRKGDGGV
ncbi:Pkinase-domain-containing protein [Piedraia hortae CBS 480.64]|uniref:non-specific serine/threonine protein kinase n=1 Tax=Piedraia hortae CBS 480.64 TaxID=1314780 RepID=A0A6A7BW90_9PEZI|nr:Pkinase-domain-containing protein [Piedraia hortae CBS 480.64]